VFFPLRSNGLVDIREDLLSTQEVLGRTNRSGRLLLGLNNTVVGSESWPYFTVSRLCAPSVLLSSSHSIPAE
jgi:hypothetical protein